MTEDAYAEFRDDTNNLTTVLRQLADECILAEAEVSLLEDNLQKAKNLLKDIVEKRIPDATDGLDGKFDLGDGRTIEIKENIRASIAGDKKLPAIKWLNEHDFGHIVKRQVIFEFGKGEEKKVADFKKAIAKLKLPLVMKDKTDVHNATLVAFIKEQLGEGVDIPTDTFGIFRQRTAKVKE